jgi:L-ascorbate metabolism protein UlaG (beta-lactamase superfamily)
MLTLLLLISGCGTAQPSNPSPPPAGKHTLPSPATAVAGGPVPERLAASIAIPEEATAPVEVEYEVTVTFLGNSGFLMSVGDKKVLIDAFRDGLPTRVKGLLTNAQPPFDHVDMVLATHSHADHFSATLIRQYMQNNPDAVFISTTEAAQQIDDALGSSNGRVIAMDPTMGNPVMKEVNSIQVEAIYWSHGTPPRGITETFNNAYIVTLNGITLFHTGDIAYPADILPYNLAEKGIDLAFFVYFFLENNEHKDVIDQGIAAHYLFPTHYPQPGFDPVKTPEKILRYYPEAIMFKDELDSWKMSLAAQK